MKPCYPAAQRHRGTVQRTAVKNQSTSSGSNASLRQRNLKVSAQDLVPFLKKARENHIGAIWYFITTTARILTAPMELPHKIGVNASKKPVINQS